MPKGVAPVQVQAKAALPNIAGRRLSNPQKYADSGGPNDSGLRSTTTRLLGLKPDPLNLLTAPDMLNALRQWHVIA